MQMWFVTTSGSLASTLLHNMAACFTVHRSTVLRRALRGALSLHGRTPGPPAGLRFVCSAAAEEKKTTILESTEEYKFVERLIPSSRVPTPPKHAGPTPSGWTPPADSPPPLPYMIRRSRMHNIPVYTDLTHGSRRTTLVRKVEGDIWALEKDVKQYLMEVTGKELPTQVNEVTMTLKIKGHYDKELKEWLTSKGF
ncbi:39S ribosomal protein L49, mitochondrial [Seriola dumerili]|uniref:39S ribosomal protein L49, mitochondrial n=1 Tax=Seriola dumerili TaxID=41447 RepID=UPI000BBEB6AA|nr:39S ribosomal protein L49, mitochondrial [Seriola dumerili]